MSDKPSTPRSGWQEAGMLVGMLLTLGSGGIACYAILQMTQDIHVTFACTAALIGGTGLLWRNA